MVEVDFSGKFTNAEKCNANDIAVFVDEGELVDRTANGNTWKQLVMTVEINEEKYLHSFRSAEGKRFQDKFGKDTKSWVGQKSKVTHIPWVDKNDNNAVKFNVELVPLEEEVSKGPTEVASVQA